MSAENDNKSNSVIERIAANRAELQALLPNTDSEKIARLAGSARWAALLVAMFGYGDDDLRRDVQDAIPEWMEAYWDSSRSSVMGPSSIDEFEFFFTEHELRIAARFHINKLS